METTMKEMFKQKVIAHVGHGLKTGLLAALFRRKPMLITALGLGVMLAMKTEKGKKVMRDVFPDSAD